MPIFSGENNKVIKIMDNNDNVILEVGGNNKETLERTKYPIVFTSEADTLEDYVIYGSFNGLGVPVNFFDKENAIVAPLYPSYSSSETNDGEVIVSNNDTVFARSLLLEVEPNTTYTFYIKKGVNENITNRMRIAGYSQVPQEGDACTFISSTPVRIGEYMSNTFTTTDDTHYILVLLWAVETSFTDDFIQNVIKTREIQLEKGTSPTDYTEYGEYRIPVLINGKNLFNSATAKIVNKWVDSSRRLQNNETARTIIIPCDSNTTYTISKNITNRFRVRLFKNYPSIGEQSLAAYDYATYDTKGTLTFTTNIQTRYIALMIASGADYDENINEIISSIQIECGSKATEFEPYTEQYSYIPIPCQLKYSQFTNYATSGKQIKVNVGYNIMTFPVETLPSKVKIRGKISSDDFDYAAYAGIDNHTVYFYNGNSLLQTTKNVPYNGTAKYTGETPIKNNVDNPEDYTFSGWSPSNVNITKDTSCYAQYDHREDKLIIDSWETISQRSAAGTSQNYYSIGDCKKVELKGTMGTLALDTTLYVYILGFDHNSSLEGTGITFGCFKTNYNNVGVDVALHDSNSNNYSTDGTKYFNMMHWGAANYGGWKGSDMRYDILGSTNVPPSGYGQKASDSRVGYDPTWSCTTVPVSNTLMSCLPKELRKVMKPITKFTDNVGGANSNTASNVTASIDYLPLLSEYEVFGEQHYANEHEYEYQAQYSYYIVGNNKIKYKHNSTNSSDSWSLRSQYNSQYTIAYIGVSAYGGVTNVTAFYSYGVAPIFLV